MTQAARRTPAASLSVEASTEIVHALVAYQKAHSLTDYDVAEFAGVSRDTIGRWRRRPTALSAKTIDRLIAGIREHEETANAARTELERLLAAALGELAARENEPAERLRRRLNSKRLRGSTVLAEIEAAGFHVVAKDKEGRK